MSGSVPEPDRWVECAVMENRTARTLALLCLVLVVGATAVGAAPATDEPPLVLFLGNSLSAGYGLGEELAFPRLVERSLAEEGLPVRVVNAGVSGDTTAGGLARVDWLLRMDPDIVVVELGGNDGLRGLAVEMTEANLREIVARCERHGAKVLLLGMRMPPNYGEYALRFESVYRTLAAETGVPWVPFLLEGVGGRAELNLPDGIHPNEEGHRILAANVTPALAEIVRSLTSD
jgi:acyl-CoA thioesterase-1